MAITPYYQDEWVTLYNTDCLEHPELWTDADYLVTDPPYGMKFKSGWSNKRHIVGDDDITSRDKALDLWGDKPALAFGRYNITPPRGERERLIWHKASSVGMGDLTRPWGLNYEVIHVLGAWTKPTGQKRRGSVYTTHESRCAPDGTHPTQKPVPLMEQLILATPDGATIADPFAGGGATLRAAKNLRRRAVGIEIDEEYCRLAASTLAQDTLF